MTISSITTKHELLPSVGKAASWARSAMPVRRGSFGFVGGPASAYQAHGKHGRCRRWPVDISDVMGRDAGYGLKRRTGGTVVISIAPFARTSRHRKGPHDGGVVLLPSPTVDRRQGWSCPTCRFEWRSSSALVVRFGGWRSLRNSTGRCWDDRPPARMLRCSPAWCRKEPQNASPPAGHGRIGQGPRRDGRSRRPESRCNTHGIAWHRVRHDRETRAVEADGSSRRRVAGPRPMTWTLTLTLTMTVTVHGPDPDRVTDRVPDRVPVRDDPQLRERRRAAGQWWLHRAARFSRNPTDARDATDTTYYVDRYVCVVPSRVAVEKGKKRAEKRIRGRSEEAKKARMLQGSNCKEQAGSANEAAQSIPAA